MIYLIIYLVIAFLTFCFLFSDEIKHKDITINVLWGVFLLSAIWFISLPVAFFLKCEDIVIFNKRVK